MLIGVPLLAAITGAMLWAAVSYAPQDYVPFASTAHAAGPDFRIIAVSEHDGHLLVEVEHFHPDGSFWYFENYIWQGREGTRKPRLLDAQGFVQLEGGGVAPWQIGTNDELVQYLPDGREWFRSSSPHLDNNSILGVIQQVHAARTDTGWVRGQSRLSEPPLQPRAEDETGIGILLSKFQALAETAYLSGNTGTLMAYAGPLPEVNPGLGLLEYGTITTVYPDAHTETDTVDGDLADNNTGPDAVWDTLRAGGGDTCCGASDSGATAISGHFTGGTTDLWNQFLRYIALFDASGIADTDQITSATFDIVLTASTDDFTDSVSMVTSTPSSNTSLIATDYAQLGTTKQAGDIAIASFTVDSSTYNSFTLNSTGLGNISKTGITKFGLRSTQDTDNAEPTWSADDNSSITFATADEVLSGDKRPRLVITHFAITAAITGTIGDGASEQEVRDGGTIIVTLTNDTWVAAGATFDAQRQAIINGLDAADSETNGWNARIRDQLGLGSVVRTSGTVATITITEAEAGDYRVAAAETVTATVPNAALVLGFSDLTATPTIALTAAAEAVAVTGTLSDGGTPAEIVAGGQTVILSLANTVWSSGGSAATTGAGQFVAANSEYLSIADNPSLSTGDIDFTMLGWVYLDSGDSNQTFFAKSQDAGDNSEYVVQYLTSNDKFRFVVSPDGTSNTTAVTANVLGVASTGTFYFIVAWHSAAANTINIQVNDGTADSGAYSSGLSDQDGDFTIGSEHGGGTSMDGRGASVLFCKCIFTAAEKSWLYNSGSGRRYHELGIAGTACSNCTTSLEGAWDLSETSGSRADSHGSNTLTDNNTVTSAGWAVNDFSTAEQQAILDGLDSDLSDRNGWDSQTFDTSDVVKTSSTRATITLTAESAYAIPATETITPTAPASVMVFGENLAGATFNITPTFKATGTRVSPAIDASGVTDVAYCSIGWEHITPTNTTILVETSLNGGTDYSTASNGSCPTGISLGSSLLAVTDFRIRVTLSTTDSAATPLILALGLVIEDTTGQELFYQLITTPAATLADRSGNSNTGTMSFPVAPAGLASTIAALTSTRASLTTEQALTSSSVVSPVSGAATNDNLFNQTELGFAALPGNSLVSAISEAGSGLPKRFIWFIFLGLVIIGSGAAALLLTQSMAWSAAVMAGVIGFTAAIGDGLMPGWIIFVFIAIAGMLVLIRPGKLAT